MSCKLLIFGVIGSSSSSYKDEDCSACDVVNIVVLVGVEIIVDVDFFLPHEVSSMELQFYIFSSLTCKSQLTYTL
jgi:hypothetical protein